MCLRSRPSPTLRRRWPHAADHQFRFRRPKHTSSIMSDTVTKPVIATAVAVPHSQPGPPEAFQVPYVIHVDGASPPPRTSSSEVSVGAWGATFCGCSTHMVPNCCMATCLPCVSMAQISSRMGIATYSQALMFFGALWSLTTVLQLVDYYTGNVSNYYRYDVNGDIVYSFHLTLWSSLAWIFSVVFTVAVWHVRSKLRQRFDIPGTCLVDCCASYWCSCCVIAQMATHVKSYKPGTCDFGPVDTLPAFQ